MKQQLDLLLEKWNLLRHPFYQAWSAGTYVELVEEMFEDA